MDIICEHIIHYTNTNSHTADNNNDGDDQLTELLWMLKNLHFSQFRTPDPEDLDRGYILMSLLLQTARLDGGAGVFRRIVGDDMMDTVLMPVVSSKKFATHAIHYPAVCLLYEVCLLQELSLDDLREVSEEMVFCLFECVDRTAKADDLEDYNYA
ncbi:hypothetical protein HK100_012211, partial [Physocladia obscura]